MIPSDRARSYVAAGHAWLESFGLGYKRDDPSTWEPSQLPCSNKGGLYSSYGSGHEQYAWDIRQEPLIIDAFAKIWGTTELLCSMDAVNLSIPLSQTDDRNADVFKPWSAHSASVAFYRSAADEVFCLSDVYAMSRPHHDQSPTLQYLHCVQGIANLAPNGPNDGGLMVLQGSSQHYNELFAKFAHLMPAEGWTTENWFPLSNPEMVDWLINDKGCSWHKVCAPEGSLILWDSRTVHYGAPPLAKNPRMATCPSSSLRPRPISPLVRSLTCLLSLSSLLQTFATSLLRSSHPTGSLLAWTPSRACAEPRTTRSSSVSSQKQSLRWTIPGGRSASSQTGGLSSPRGGSSWWASCRTERRCVSGCGDGAGRDAGISFTFVSSALYELRCLL